MMEDSMISGRQSPLTESAVDELQDTATPRKSEKGHGKKTMKVTAKNFSPSPKNEKSKFKQKTVRIADRSPGKLEPGEDNQTSD